MSIHVPRPAELKATRENSQKFYPDLSELAEDDIKGSLGVNQAWKER